ncbi:MAG: HK97 family phage prohead protease [Verrucomicrobiota bacterium]
MAETYRAPKSVQEELEANHHLAIAISEPLTIEDVVSIRKSWIGSNGIEWANKIAGAIEERATVLKGQPMAEARDDGAPDTVADLFTVIETALDALKDLVGVADTDATTDLELNSGDTPSVETRVEEESPMIEERKALLASAERITMNAEVRAVPSKDGALKIAGYAATFDTEADNLNFREKIAPGAFTRSLEGSDPIFLLINHQADQLPLASTQSGTLKLTQDAVGLRMEADLDAKNPRAQELASALTRGDVNKMSFAFSINPGGEVREAGVRTLTDITVYEVSVVNMPAYESTQVGMRSAEEIEAEALEMRKKQMALKVRLAELRK